MSSPPPLPPAPPRRKPFVLFAVAGAAIVLALFRLRTITAAVSLFSENGIIETFGAIGLSVSVIVFSGLIVRMIAGDHLNNTKPLIGYLWCMLLLPLLIALMRLFGFHIEHVSLPTELLFFGALVDIGQFLIPITLLVWIAVSRELRAYLVR